MLFRKYCRNEYECWYPMTLIGAAISFFVQILYVIYIYQGRIQIENDSIQMLWAPKNMSPKMKKSKKIVVI